MFQSGDGPIRTRTVTDRKGHFQLPGVIEGKAILFARKNGFRFQGQPIDTEAGRGRARLTRSDETPGPSQDACQRPAPARRARPWRNDCSLRTSTRSWLKGNDRKKFQALVALAPIDPSRVLELIETQGDWQSPCSLWTASAASSPPDWPGRARTRR